MGGKITGLTINTLLERLAGRLRKELPALLLTLLLPTLICVVVAILFPEEVDTLFRDTVAVAHASGLYDFPAYAGALSNMGILLWGISGAICLFSAWLVMQSDGRASCAWRFPAATGALSFVLLFDDLFLLHEYVLPARGISEYAVLATYALSMAAYMFFFRKDILERQTTLFLAAGGLFTLSLVVDYIGHSNNGILLVLEDGAKLAAIFCWTSFACLISRDTIHAMRPAPTGETSP